MAAGERDGAMNFFNMLFKKKPDRPESDEPVSPVFQIGGQPIRLINMSAALSIEAAYRRVPQLYRITHFIASSVQSVPWYCDVDPDVTASDQAKATDIKAINKVLKSPNENMTSQQFAYWTTTNIMLYGRSHFKVGVATGGMPNGLYPLAAKYTKGILNNRGTVESYEYGESPETKQIYPSRRVAEKRGKKEAYAAEISLPTLSGLIEYNKSPAAIESISKPLAIIDALMQRALDTANGHANIKYVITAEKTLTKQQKEALERHLAESAPGEEESGSVLFLYNTTVVVHKLDNDLKDIHSKLPLDDMTRQIAGVFGVPIALMGLGSADSAKYASNYQESRRSFWQDTIAPSYLVPIASGMTAAICPSGAKVFYDFDSIPAMWEDRAKLGETLSRVNFLTSDEKREILGFKPDPNIPQVMLSSGTAVTGDGEPVDGAPPPPTGDNVAPPAKEMPLPLRAVQ
jgi:phage portal protein BeeE